MLTIVPPHESSPRVTITKTRAISNNTSTPRLADISRRIISSSLLMRACKPGSSYHTGMRRRCGGCKHSGRAGQRSQPEVSVAMRDRDVKTQRRKEAIANLRGGRKQRKKEESELLSSKAQELVRESTSLRAELEKVQNQADKLYKENLELRSQVSKAGGTLPPAPPPVVPRQTSSSHRTPASLFKEVVVSAGPGTAKKQESSDPAAVTTTGGEGKTQKKRMVKDSKLKVPRHLLCRSSRRECCRMKDRPAFSNELNNGENGGEHFAQRRWHRMVVTRRVCS